MASLGLSILHSAPRRSFTVWASDSAPYRHLLNLRLHEKSERRRCHRLLLEGSRSIHSILLEQQRSALFRCHQIIIRSGTAIDSTALEPSITSLARSLAVPIHYLPVSLFNRLANHQTPSGFMAEIELPTPHEDEQSRSQFITGVCSSSLPVFPLSLAVRGLVLDRLSDPGNLGSIIRSAASFNYQNIILIQCVHPFSSKVMQSTVGNMSKINLHWFPDVSTFLQTWQSNRRHSRARLIALHPSASISLGLAASDPSHLPYLVIGNEANGVSKELLNSSDQRIAIEMRSQVDSINAAAAAAIAMWKFRGNEIHDSAQNV